MMGSRGDSDDETSSIETRVVERAESWVDGLDDFLFETRHLFTLIGVFGALSIYIRQADLPATGPDKIPYTNIVSFFGFGLVLLLLIIVFVKLTSRIFSSEPSDLILHPKNIPYLVFLLFLMPIVATLVQYLSTFPTSAALFWYSVVYLLAPATVFWAHDSLITKVEIQGILADKFGQSRNTVLIFLLLTTALASFVVFILIDYIYGSNILDTLLAGERSSQRWILLVAFFSSIWFYAAIAGLLITVIRIVRQSF